MQFGVLGPLEVSSRGIVVPVKGTKQRAVLGYLLLHANQVVATSNLLKALWPDEVPSTARKMVQNAVSGLRNVLAAHEGESSALLLTHAPGYLLRVPPEQIDLRRFETLAQAARTSLAHGHSEQAAEALREALRLWRGPALADLAESGVDWPELAKIRDMRVATQEDYFDIRLDHGRHMEILSELGQVFEAEPHRERLCRQLMTALYRAGRHVEALQVYRRTRDAMLEDLGLEPGRELRELERAILEHDTALQPPTPIRPVVLDEEPVTGNFPFPAEVSRPAEQPVPARSSLAPASVVERRLVSVLSITLHQGIDRDPEEVERLLADTAQAMREEVEHAGGTVVGTTGSMLLSVFGVPCTHSDDVPRAVRTALAIRDRLLARNRSTGTGTDFRIAVVTGEVLAKYSFDRDADLTIAGTVVDTCALMTNAARRATVWVCEDTWQAAASLIASSERAEVPAMRRVEAMRETPAPQPQHARAPFMGRDLELDQLQRALNRTARLSRPQLHTVVGESGIGKSRLVQEFVETVTTGSDLAEDVRGAAWPRPSVLTAHVPESCDDIAPLALADLTRACLGGRHDEPALVESKLADLVHRVVGRGARAERLISWLTPLALFPSRGEQDGALDIVQASYALRALLEAIAASGPLIIVFEDLHRADARLLEFIARLSQGSGPVALLIVITACPELLSAHPGWHGAARNAATMTLEPLPDAVMEELLDSWLDDDSSTEPLRKAALAKAGGNPLFAIEYAKAIGTGRFSEEHPPDQVRRVLGTRLTALSADEKTVLKDAAVLGEMITAAGIAAVGEHGEQRIDDITRCLERLERLHLLCRVPDLNAEGGQTYDFSQVLICDIAYLELPHAQRAAKHGNAALWIDGLTTAGERDWDAQHTYRMHHHRHMTAAAGLFSAGRTSPITQHPDRSRMNFC